MEFCATMFIKEKINHKKVALSALDPPPFVLAHSARRVGLFLTADFTQVSDLRVLLKNMPN